MFNISSSLINSVQLAQRAHRCSRYFTVGRVYGGDQLLRTRVGVGTFRTKYEGGCLHPPMWGLQWAASQQPAYVQRSQAIGGEAQLGEAAPNYRETELEWLSFSLLRRKSWFKSRCFQHLAKLKIFNLQFIARKVLGYIDTIHFFSTIYCDPFSLHYPLFLLIL